MYEYTDKVILYMKKRFIRLFSNFKSQSSFDELNVISSAKALYDELKQIVIECFVMIARHAYLTNGGLNEYFITEELVVGWLGEYDPVAKYVFMHEIDRKCARFAESVIASPNPAQEIDTALRYWSDMVSQFAITVTDKAVDRAYHDSGVERVIWITERDEKRCKVCGKRDNVIYDIAKVPPKPHLRCRCYIRPYWGGVN